MKRFLPWLILCAIGMTSCARLGIGKSKQDPAPNPFGGGSIPPQLRAKKSDDGTTVPPGGNANAAIENQLTPEEDIIFTDPDNLEAGLPELSAILTSPKRRGPWEESETIAKKRAAREGKPIVIWFTNSQMSPMCKTLNQELYATPDFTAWAADKVVLLKVDANVRAHESLKDAETIGSAMDREVALKNYVATMKKRYKVLGHPYLVMLNPSGSVMLRRAGYKRGDADFYWGLIKQGEVASSHAQKSWRDELEKKGYREWKDRKGRAVFAKLTNYSDGTLTLIEPDGTRCRTDEKKLSDEDRDWIDEQKRLRGIQ